MLKKPFVFEHIETSNLNRSFIARHPHRAGVFMFPLFIRGYPLAFYIAV
jgi:hypothetical protein